MFGLLKKYRDDPLLSHNLTSIDDLQGLRMEQHPRSVMNKGMKLSDWYVDKIPWQGMQMIFVLTSES